MATGPLVVGVEDAPGPGGGPDPDLDEDDEDAVDLGAALDPDDLEDEAARDPVAPVPLVLSLDGVSRGRSITVMSVPVSDPLPYSPKSLDLLVLLL